MNVLVILLATFTVVYSVEDGQYQPDDEGRYVPDNSGDYIPDFSGTYVHDLSGNYKSDGAGGYTPERNPAPVLRNAIPLSNPVKTSFSGAASAPSASYAQPASPDGRWKILKFIHDQDLDSYNWAYDTENGISAEESGKLANAGTNSEVMRAKGAYKYTGPDNVLYAITYTADENGFVAAGNHLPTPVPLPEANIKAIEYLNKFANL